MSENRERQMVVLEEKQGSRRFPIVIGFPEVFAIHRFVNDEPPPRPLTHELMGSILEHLNATLQKIVINDIQDGTYHARLFLEQGGATVDLDSRPSDAIALAIHLEAPIFVEDDVLVQAAEDFN
jgi:bifunctional DNase/RNase